MDTYTGTWSIFTLLITVIMLMYSLVLMVVLLVYALMGRFRSKPQQAAVFSLEEEPGDDDDEDEEDTAPVQPAPPARRKTGLWQLLVALCSAIPAVMALSWVDNIYGRLATFTWGTAICLALFAAQIFFTVWFVRIQRRYGQSP